MPGYVQRILGFQIVAEVVYFRFDTHHLHELAVGDMYFIQRLYHLVRSLCEQRFHHFDIAVLLLGVWQPVAMTVRDITRQVEIGVTNRLQLAYYTQHLVHLMLRLVGQTSVSNLIEVCSNLNLHTVTYTFILLDSGIDLYKILLLVGME